jgi:hypothetical protein
MSLKMDSLRIEDSFAGVAVPAGAITVGASTNLVAEISIPAGAEVLSLAIKNAHASVAFDDFILTRKAQTDAAEETIADSDADYTATPLVSPLMECSGSPRSLAAAASVFLRMDVRATRQVMCYASGNGAASTATIHATIQ